MKISDRVKKVIAVLWVLWFVIGAAVLAAVSTKAGGIILVALAAVTVTGGIAFLSFKNTLKRLEKKREEEKAEEENQ